MRVAAPALAVGPAPSVLRIPAQAGWSLCEVCIAYGIWQKFIKPHCPWPNGKVERFNRTLQPEWSCRQPLTTNGERTAAIAP